MTVVLYRDLNFANMQVVTSLADPSANIIFGAVVDERYNGEIHVTIVATGFAQSFQKTFLTDSKGLKSNERGAGGQENIKSSIPLKTLTPSSTQRSNPRKLFF